MTGTSAEMTGTSAIILAAGLGKRMNSPLPKVLHPAAGRTLLEWVVSSALSAGIEEVIAVVGPWKDDHDLPEGPRYVVQRERLGTGHAVGVALPEVSASATDVAVLCGDVPGIRPDTIRNLIGERRRRAAAAVVLTFEPGDPSGYGRIERRPDGRISAIVEEVDADEATRAIREVNSGTYAFEKGTLIKYLPELDCSNRQGEYYLTDLVKASTERGVYAVRASDIGETLGVNSREDLLAAERILLERMGKRD